MSIVLRGLCDDDVQLVQSCGSDLLVFRAARCSYLGEDEEPTDARLKKFIKELLRNKHLVPFEHCVMTFHLCAPIFVFRQLFRYRTTAISEQSMRFCEAVPEFYLPDASDENSCVFKRGYNRAWKDYQTLLAAGEPRERARAVLPVAVFSRCLLTINLRNFLHVCEQRLKKEAQEETRFIVKRMFMLAREVYPVTLGEFQW